MSETLDLEAELGALALPDDDAIGKLLKAVRWLSGLSPDLATVTHALVVPEIFRQPRKRARLAYCLIGLYERVQRVASRVDTEYVRRDEFADLLEDALRRAVNEPDEGRRTNYEKILAGIMTRNPQRQRHSFEQERMVIRLANELSTDHLKVVLAHFGPELPEEITLARRARLQRRAAAGAPFDRLVEDLCSFRVMERDQLDTVAHRDQMIDGLTSVGLRLAEYLREV